MRSFEEIVKLPFESAELEHQVLAALAVLVAGSLVWFCLRRAIRRRRDHRRYWRHPLLSIVDVSWQDDRGGEHRQRGHCRDLSLGGLRIELDESIECDQLVYFRVFGTGLNGEARIRHSAQEGSAYVMGLEFIPVKRKSLPGGSVGGRSRRDFKDGNREAG